MEFEATRKLSKVFGSYTRDVDSRLLDVRDDNKNMENRVKELVNQNDELKTSRKSVVVKAREIITEKVEEKREIIKEKQEEIYGEIGVSTGFSALTAQLNRICHALQLDTGTDEIVVLNRIESLVRYKMKHDGMIEDALPKFNLRPHVEDDGEVLDVAFLRLDEIPDSISELANLTAVYASHNNIINLPDSLCSLSNLIELDVSDNNLTSLPEAFGELTSIMLLFLSNNELASLPPSIVKLSNLEEMDVSGNQLCCLPDNMESLARLKILTIYGNDDLVVPGSMASVEIII